MLHEELSVFFVNNIFFSVNFIRDFIPYITDIRRITE